MNEDEKIASQSEASSAIPAPAEEPLTPSTQAPASDLLPERQCSPQASAPAEETAEQRAASSPSIYHQMSKEELAACLKRFIDDNNMQAHRDVQLIRQAFFNIRQREADSELNAFVEAGNDPALFSATPDRLETEIKEMVAEFKEKRTLFLEEEDKRRKENLAAKQAVIDSIRTLLNDVDNINLHYPRFQELQAEFKSIKEVPPTDEAEVWKTYQGVVEQYYDLLKLNKELRDLDFKKNLEAKRQLIERARKLADLADVVEAGRQLQSLHNEWREIGPVAKEMREEIWEEFKAASTVVNKRHQDHFQNLKAAEQANEEAKTRLCEEAEAINIEAIDSYSGWDKGTEQIKDLQRRWKEIGFAPRKANNALFARFRAVCDRFFEQKAEFYKKNKEEARVNLERKIDLCKRAEALKDSTDRKKAMEEILALQAEWKTVGSVARRHSDAVWERFNAACNVFFAERKKALNERRSEENANLAAKRDIIARIKEIPLDGDRRETIAAVRALQDEWQKAGHVPFRIKEELYKEYREACDAVYNAVDAKGRSERTERFRSRVERMGENARPGANPVQRALEQKRQELKTYQNNLGFFNVKTSAGNSMLKEMERKITRLQEEIALLEEKL